jgi:hypothetical protein
MGCGVLLALASLALAAPLHALSQRGANVETAVRASFPNFCGEWRDKIRVRPAALGFYATWTVSCESGFWNAPPQAAMTVNLLTCAAYPVFRPSPRFDELYAALAAPGEKLAVCP